MGKQALVLGGSVAGLSAAVALARQGWTVTVIERDPGSPTDDGDAAFVEWERRSVPHFRQPHGFSSRSRNLLLEHIPEVVTTLTDAGIQEINIFKMVAPPEMWTEEDERFTGLQTRRPAFELAMRQVAEREPGVEIRCPEVVSGLLYDTAADAIARVTGVRLADGSELAADVVLDCGGRRTPVPRWLKEDRGIEVPEDVQDCDSTYFTRYYRLSPDSSLHPVMLFGIRGESERLAWAAFTGDNRTFGLSFFASPSDAELRVLRHNWAWEAAAALVPALVPWIDPANALPLHDVAVMSNHENVRRHYVVRGEPLVLGLLSVGDALCTTNPQYGWGASMALTYAFSAVQALMDHGDDQRAVALDYEQRIADEADAVFRQSAASDRWRIYHWRDEPIPDWDAEAMAEQDLILEGVAAGALRDPILGRAMLRRMNLLDRPDAVLADPDVRERAENTRRILAGKPPRKLGPTRAELLEALAAADPSRPARQPEAVSG